ncbi:MAG: hypothetical protein KF886_17555 [Candidatus Hydrogenedentes bacterium]|nr:hypothetical protein [Candidatus Hydrogenedentota bacterium]
MRSVSIVGLTALLFSSFPSGAQPVPVGPFEQEFHRSYTAANGLPSDDVQRVAVAEDGAVIVQTAGGSARWDGAAWAPLDASAAGTVLSLEKPFPDGVAGVEAGEIWGAAERDGERVVAAELGLFHSRGGAWAMLLPHDGARRWAPIDVRAVDFDHEGNLWFASPQGVGRRDTSGAWTLYTGAEGLPFNDFTCLAAGPGGVWFGTTNGAVLFDGEGQWRFRQGRRWLQDNHVNDIAVAPDGAVWIATPGGVSCIARKPMTLAEKAALFEAEIDRYHRRTEYGYVADALMPEPGVKAGAEAQPTDNDGHYTGIYLASASLGYAATGNPALKEKAHRAFEALAFLSEVTQGGSLPAPPGFIARCIRPTNGPDPNEEYSHEYDRVRLEGDTLWKQMPRRWPTDASGKWYWLCDSSSDELDGHYFGYGAYYDRVCETEAERERVRAVVRRVTDHLIDNNYTMIDYDGKPTRWGHFSPESLNQDGNWWFESGLNAQSILTYLQVAHHVTGDPKYREHYLKLAWEHGYAMKTVTTPKIQFGPGSLGQGDDNMAFMNYYHLIRYETDSELLAMYRNSIYWYWNIEKYERSPYFNFIYAACNDGHFRTDQWRSFDLSPPARYMALGVDTLKRYPIDLIDWPLSNAHRIDVTRLGDHTQGTFTNLHEDQGHGLEGLVYPIDEQHCLLWGEDPWRLSHAGNPQRLRDPTPFLIAYYMGLAHGFIAE